MEPITHPGSVRSYQNNAGSLQFYNSRLDTSFLKNKKNFNMYLNNFELVFFFQLKQQQTINIKF